MTRNERRTNATTGPISSTTYGMSQLVDFLLVLVRAAGWGRDAVLRALFRVGSEAARRRERTVARMGTRTARTRAAQLWDVVRGAACARHALHRKGGVLCCVPGLGLGSR